MSTNLFIFGRTITDTYKALVTLFACYITFADAVSSYLTAAVTRTCPKNITNAGCKKKPKYQVSEFARIITTLFYKITIE